MAMSNSNTFKGFTINTGDGKYFCDEHILEQYDKRLQFMLSKNSRVVQKRFDLTYPQDGFVEPEPAHIYRFTENLRRDLKRNNPLPEEGKKRSPGRKGEAAPHPVNPQMLWVKEQEAKAPHPHYHFVVFVNGNAIRSGWAIQKKAERQWANAIGQDEVKGLVDICNQNGPDSILVDKHSPDFDSKINAAYHQGSYLAKTRGKQNRAKGEHKSGGTRVPKNEDERTK